MSAEPERLLLVPCVDPDCPGWTKPAFVKLANGAHLHEVPASERFAAVLDALEEFDQS